MVTIAKKPEGSLVSRLRTIAAVLRETSNFTFANEIDEAADYILAADKEKAMRGVL